ncbi:hypothetical protein ABZ446_33595 [Streptomyces sp. NPDC005813]|uniref:hypothetical protein n=1 Tax=Streptomyces sp. NPDC005813 TaxID=3155592 RepID=UPI0033E3BBEE
MNESRPSRTGMSTVLRKGVPPPALCGFLLLLALMFALSYVAGAFAGPVAPGMRGADTRSPGGGGHTDGTDDMGDMGEGGH